MESQNAAFHIEGQCIFKNIEINNYQRFVSGPGKMKPEGKNHPLLLRRFCRGRGFFRNCLNDG